MYACRIGVSLWCSDIFVFVYCAFSACNKGSQKVAVKVHVENMAWILVKSLVKSYTLSLMASDIPDVHRRKGKLSPELCDHHITAGIRAVKTRQILLLSYVFSCILNLEFIIWHAGFMLPVLFIILLSGIRQRNLVL